MLTNFTRFTSSTRFTSFTSYLAHRWADFRAFFDEICCCSCFFWPSPPSTVSRKMPVSGGFGSSSWETHCLIADCIFRVSADSSTPVRDLGEKICVSCERFPGQWTVGWLKMFEVTPPDLYVGLGFLVYKIFEGIWARFETCLEIV